MSHLDETFQSQWSKFRRKKLDGLVWNGVAEHCLLELDDAWVRFCRAMVIESVLDRRIGWRTSGVWTGPSLRSTQDVNRELCRYLGPRNVFFGEPKWQNPDLCIRSVHFFATRNAANISLGLGLPSPAIELRAARNFVAHHNRVTALALRPIASAYGTSHLSQLHNLLETLVVPGIPLLRSWIAEFRNIAEVASKIP